MASGRQVQYRLNLQSNATSVLNSDSAAANKFDNSMWQVQKTLSAFGLGLGAHFLIDAAKGWTQAAADYEQAMLRIKNASSEGFGIVNEQFVNNQVDKFKTKLQETSDAYGNFLFKIKNANLTNDISNRLFENLSIVSKVGGISQEQMDATVRNVGILLGEGVLEARHLRQLSYVHPQIVPYLADALGLKGENNKAFSALLGKDTSEESASQMLSQLISSGKLTKSSLNANIIIDAFEKYRLSIETKLPETLKTVQSEINDLSNAWERFKNSTVLGEKPELVQFFNDLKSGINWLVNHEEGIVKTGKAIAEIIGLYAGWRLALVALQLPAGILGFFANEHQRLNTILGIGKEKIIEQSIANQVLVESDIKVIETTQSKVLNLEEEHNELNKLALSLNQVSIQTDLFTQAQILNTSSVERMGFALTELDGVMKVSANYMDKNISQMSLFTDSELEMTAAMKTSSDAIAIQNEQLRIRNEILAENSILSEKNALIALGTLESMKGNTSIINPYKFSASSITSGLMNVFIAGMAIEVANQLLPQGKISKDGITMSDWGYAAAQLVDIPSHLLGWTNKSGFWGNGFNEGKGFGHAKKIGEENSMFNQFQNELNVRSSDITKFIPSNGDFLYKLLEKSGFLDKVDPIDKFGKRFTDNSSVFDLLKRSGWSVPYVLTNESDSKSSNGKGKLNLKLPDEKSTRLRGNSSNFFTVTIHGGLNGLKDVTFKNSDAATMKDIENEVGIQITRNMLQIINDIQVVKTGH